MMVLGEAVWLFPARMLAAASACSDSLCTPASRLSRILMMAVWAACAVWSARLRSCSALARQKLQLSCSCAAISAYARSLGVARGREASCARTASSDSTTWREVDYHAHVTPQGV